MTETTSLRPHWAVLAAAAAVAVAFGILTIIVGGETLFGSPAASAAAGNIVPFAVHPNIITVGGYGFRTASLRLASGMTK